MALTELDSSDADVKEELEPVTDGLLGTCNVDDRRRLFTALEEPAQLFGILKAQRLWKFSPQAGTRKQIQIRQLHYRKFIDIFVNLQPLLA